MLSVKSRAVWSAYLRNLRLVFRQRNLIVQTAIVPVAVLLLSAVVFGAGGDQWPIALVDKSNSPQSREVVEAIKDSRSNITPYFNVVETDPEKAASMVESGRLQMLVTIPENFSKNQTVETFTFNTNSDATKNFRLRLDYALNHTTSGAGTIDARLATERPEDVWRSAYYGGSTVLLAMFLGATLVAANLFVMEREKRTIKEILLTPLNPVTAGLGIVLTAVSLAYLASLLPLTVAWLLFPFEISVGRLASVYLLMFPVLVACAGLGVFLGHLLRTYRVVQPAIVLTTVATFFAGGGFAGVSFLQPTAQAFANIWLFSRIFEWFNPLLHGFTDGFSLGQIASISGSAIVGLALLALSYRRELTLPTGGGQ